VNRAIRPDWLLRQADQLGYRNAGAGQPRNGDLRRAVSAAYYAVFHEMVSMSVSQLLPDGTDEERYRLSRSFPHGDLKTVCGYVVNANGAPREVQLVANNLAAVAHVKDIAIAFVDLQEARHRADYDHLADFSKASVLAYVDSAKDAVSKIRGLAAVDRQRLVSLLALKAKLK
jgi:uncharacterized protein (UPF0332 family)